MVQVANAFEKVHEKDAGKLYLLPKIYLKIDLEDIVKARQEGGKEPKI